MESEKNKQPSVVVYSTPTCPFCVMVKRYLNEKGISYTDYNVAQNQQKALEMLTKSGQLGVPVIDINGQIIIGFDKPAIDKALSLK